MSEIDIAYARSTSDLDYLQRTYVELFGFFEVSWWYHSVRGVRWNVQEVVLVKRKVLSNIEAEQRESYVAGRIVGYAQRLVD